MSVKGHQAGSLKGFQFTALNLVLPQHQTPSGMLQGTRTFMHMTVTVCQPIGFLRKLKTSCCRGGAQASSGSSTTLELGLQLWLFLHASPSKSYVISSLTLKGWPLHVPRALPLGTQLPALEAALLGVLRARFSFGFCVGFPAGLWNPTDKAP